MTEREPSPGEALAASLRRAATILATAGREDAAAELQTRLTALLEPEMRVAFVGPFKSGKGSLINSLLNVNVCPTDADQPSTSVVELRYGEEFEVAGTDGSQGTLDARLPRALLKLGVVLIDVPGVPGAGSSEHERALEVASTCDAVVWVCSAGRELTADDLSVVRSLHTICPQLAVALAKSDLYPAAEAIRERDEQLLRTLDGRCPVTVTSARLRRAGLDRQDSELDALSGVPHLVNFIARDLRAQVQIGRVRRVAAEAVATIQQERWRLDRAEEALREPSEAEARLRAAQERLQRARTSGARWRTELREAFSDAANAAANDLKNRIATVLREAEEEIGRRDPSKAWSEIEARLRQQLRQAVIENNALLETRVLEATRTVADRLDAELHDVDRMLGFDPAAEALTATEHELSVELGRISFLDLGMSTVRGAYLPGLMFSALASAAGLAVTVATGGVVAVAAAALGGRAFVQERERQLKRQRQEAMKAVRRYTEEISAASRQALQDGIAEVRSAMAERFINITVELESSANDALYEARRAAQTDVADRNRRLAEVEAQRRALAEVDAAIRTHIPEAP